MLPHKSVNETVGVSPNFDSYSFRTVFKHFLNSSNLIKNNHLEVDGCWVVTFDLTWELVATESAINPVKMELA